MASRSVLPAQAKKIYRTCWKAKYPWDIILQEGSHLKFYLDNIEAANNQLKTLVLGNILPMISSILQPTTMVADDGDLTTAIKSQTLVFAMNVADPGSGKTGIFNRYSG